MFSLIITIVSIALVVALVAATLYHGGDTLTQGRVTAKASEYVAGAQQIAGAYTMNQALNGQNAATVQALISAGTLKSVPALFIADAMSTAIIPKGVDGSPFTYLRSPYESLTLEECHALDKLAGRAPTPEGSFPVQYPTANGFDTWHAYGCYLGESYSFYFKV